MFEKRILSLQDSISRYKVEALLITSNYNIAYLTGILAFSLEEREARILVTKQDIFLFTDARYTEMVKNESPFVTLIETNSDKTFSKNLKEILKKKRVRTLGFEEENITYKEISELEEEVKGVEFVPTEGIVEDLRTVKDNNEVANIKKACALTDKAFEFILKNLKPGVTELEIKTKLESLIRDNGGEIAFPSIVAFGKNSAIPHHQSGNLKLKTENVVLLDFGAKVNGYCSDMTRTIFIGKPSDKQIKIYNAVKEAQEIAIDYLKTHAREGFELKKVQELANSHLRKLGFSDIPHSLGHGVGLQVHEEPRISPYSEGHLQEGTVITVEPGVYISDIGGVRIEDTVLITDNGLEFITKSQRELVVL